MSPGRDQDYLCEGLAEELINVLTAYRRVARRVAYGVLSVPQHWCRHS